MAISKKLETIRDAQKRDTVSRDAANMLFLHAVFRKAHKWKCPDFFGGNP